MPNCIWHGQNCRKKGGGNLNKYRRACSYISRIWKYLPGITKTFCVLVSALINVLLLSTALILHDIPNGTNILDIR